MIGANWRVRNFSTFRIQLPTIDMSSCVNYYSLVLCEQNIFITSWFNYQLGCTLSHCSNASPNAVASSPIVARMTRLIRSNGDVVKCMGNCRMRWLKVTLVRCTRCARAFESICRRAPDGNGNAQQRKCFVVVFNKYSGHFW